MKVSVRIKNDSLRRNLRRLEKGGPRAFQRVAETLAAQGREYARDIITVQIYATPERSGYKRTRQLIRSIYGATEKDGTGFRIIIGASVGYAAYNEFGTYDGYAGDDAAEEQIITAARQARRQDLIVLEYGRPAKGLEPRPYILPAIIMVERELPDLVNRAIERLLL